MLLHFPLCAKHTSQVPPTVVVVFIPPVWSICRKLVNNNVYQCRVIEVLLTRGPWTGREEMDYDTEQPYVVFASKGVSLLAGHSRVQGWIGTGAV